MRIHRHNVTFINSLSQDHDMISIITVYYAGIDSVIKTMPRKRFKKLVQYIHLNDNTMMKPRGDPGYHPLHKIRPL